MQSGGEGRYSGWMYKLKLGKRFKQTWKRRYFTLTDTHLHYYVNQSVCAGDGGRGRGNEGMG